VVTVGLADTPIVFAGELPVLKLVPLENGLIVFVDVHVNVTEFPFTIEFVFALNEIVQSGTEIIPYFAVIDLLFPGNIITV